MTKPWCSSEYSSSNIRAATGDSPEPREKPRSGRRRKETKCLRGVAWHRGFLAHGEGELLRSVKAGVYSNTPHEAAGSKHGGLVGVCAHRTSPRCRTNPRAGIFGGCFSYAERAAAHHSRENAGWGFAAAERSSCAHMAVVCVLPTRLLCVHMCVWASSCCEGRSKKRCHKHAVDSVVDVL